MKILKLNKNYSATKLGFIYSNKTKKIIKPYLTKTGYFRLNLRSGKNRKNHFVHRLIASSFLKETTVNRNQVNHKNGNKLDNRVCNLEWVSCSENHKHAFKNNLRKPSHLKFDLADIYNIEFLLKKGVPSRIVAKKYNVDQKTILNIKHKRLKYYENLKDQSHRNG